MRRKFGIIATLLLCLLLGVTAVLAQVNGTVSLGQPTAINLTAGQTAVYSYSLSQSSNVAFQVFGDTVQPTVTILRDGEVVFSEPNVTSQAILSLNAFLSAGEYIIEIGSANNAGGTVVIVVTGETPVTPITLIPGSPSGGEVTTQNAFALYTFDALAEPAYLYIDSGLVESGVNATLVNTTTGDTSGMLNAGLTGGRFRIPAGAAAYQVEVSHGGSVGAEPFTICFVAVSVGGCEGSLPPAPTLPPTAIVQPTAVLACTLSPSGGSANIRQSATTASIIVGSIPGNGVASVIGISPDGTFYNIIYNNVTGWVSRTVATVSGNCANVPVINPPPVIFPTATNTPIPTIPPIMTLPAPIPTPSGPCLISVVAEFLIYTVPNAIPENLYDEVQPGYELIPTGRLADDSWWVTNYGGAWIQTGRFGSEAIVTGDCRNLPVVSAP